MWLKVLVVAILALSGSATIVRSVSAIIGGSPDTTSQYNVVYLRTNEVTCTGSLIAPTWILTAAHCVVNDIGTSATYMSVLAIRDSTSRPIWQSTAAGFVLNNYSRTLLQNDLALVQIRDSIPGPYAELANGEELRAVEDLGGSGIASGFGRTSYEGSRSAVLLQVSVQLVPANICRGNWTYFLPYDANFICTAPNTTATTCRGDSGGPLFVSVGGIRKIAGVTSFGAEVCGENYSVSTRAPSYLGWIKQTISPGTSPSTTVPTSTTVAVASTTTSTTATTLLPESQVVVFPAIPPAVPVAVPPLYPTVADTGKPVLPKFSTTRAFQLVTEASGGKCRVDIDASVELRGRRLDVFLGKSQVNPNFRRILDQFGDTVINLAQNCASLLRSGVFVRLEDSSIRFKAVL
jgi:secreted trypsin-like serine protease